MAPCSPQRTWAENTLGAAQRTPPRAARVNTQRFVTLRPSQLTQILPPLRIIPRNPALQLSPLIPPMRNIASHLRPAPRMHIHHIILDHRLPLPALDDSPRPPCQLHRHIVLGSTRQQTNRMRAINPTIPAIDHARSLRIKRLDNRRSIHQPQPHILGSDNLQPAPQHLFRLQPIRKKLISRQRRLLHQARAGWTSATPNATHPPQTHSP